MIIKLQLLIIKAYHHKTRKNIKKRDKNLKICMILQKKYRHEENAVIKVFSFAFCFICLFGVT